MENQIMEETVKSSLESADNKGNKVPWFLKKIADLEAKVQELGGDSNNNGATLDGASPASNRIFADGFVAAMHTFQIHNKSARQQIHRQMCERGPNYARKVKGSKFRGFTL